jgi:predicted AAA+ superfamily ATPase
MWIKRDLSKVLQSETTFLPIRVLKGPRQTGKTSLLAQLPNYRLVSLDDAATRRFAQEQPKLFLEQMGNRVILDEATLAPQLFHELKRRVDEYRLGSRNANTSSAKPLEEPHYWVTGSNQTLLRTAVQESLAGRASYFDLNTLSIHELGSLWKLDTYLLRGGWPELYVSPSVAADRYLNDFTSSFIEHDIIAAAGIEKHAAFFKVLGLCAGRISSLLNASDIAKNVGVESTTVSSWISILEQNGILRQLPVYSSNLNQRLIKTPKLYFEDVALASRLQGWTQADPLMLSPYFGHMIENCAVNEVSRFFTNQGMQPALYFLRNKEKVEIDLLIELPNQRWIAAEIKTTAQPWSKEQAALVDSLKLNIVERWVIAVTPDLIPGPWKVVPLNQIWDSLNEALNR